MHKRFFAIDFLRAIGIIGVIATHVFSYNLVPGTNTFIWNYLHFVITSFIFCSGYVMYVVYQERVATWKSLLPWYKKRFSRLLIPYYLYFGVHLSLVWVAPKYFSGLGIQINWHYIWQSLTFLGGMNENWLPLLFVQLALLFPVLVYLVKKQRKLLWVYCAFCLVFTVWITLTPFPYSLYRWTMWIPWSLVLVLAWYFAKSEMTTSSTKIYALMSIVSAVLFAGLFVWFGDTHRSLTLIDNKYPPNLFYTSYEFAISFALLTLAQVKTVQQKIVVTISQFLSKHSYELFFIHFLILDFVLQLNKMYSWHLSVWVELFVVILLSISSIYFWEKIRPHPSRTKLSLVK